MAIDLKRIDELLRNYKKPEDIIGEGSLLKQLTKAVLERALAAEMSQHVGYEKHATEGRNSSNSRNGSTKKTLKGDFCEMELETPRDRAGSFEPKIGKPGDVLDAGSCPGAVVGYQVNSRVSDGTALGQANFQVAAAWIAGSSVKIQVQ